MFVYNLYSTPHGPEKHSMRVLLYHSWGKGPVTLCIYDTVNSSSKHCPGKKHSGKNAPMNYWMNMLLLLLSRSSRVRLWQPQRRQPTRLPRPWDSPGRTLEWVAISFSNAWKWKVKVKSLSRVWLLATPWTAAHQAPPSLGLSRPEHWRGMSVRDTNIVLSAPVVDIFLKHWTLGMSTLSCYHSSFILWAIRKLKHNCVYVMRRNFGITRNQAFICVQINQYSGVIAQSSLKVNPRLKPCFSLTLVNENWKQQWMLFSACQIFSESRKKVLFETLGAFP